jgi:hypothetical protein
VLEQTRTDALADPAPINGKLTQQQARDRIRRLASANRTRQHGSDDPGRRQPIVADDSAILMNDHHRREPFLLI